MISLGYQPKKNFRDNIRPVSKDLLDIRPVIEAELSGSARDNSSIIPFAQSKVDLLFLVSSDDGVTNSVEQVILHNIRLY